MMTISKAWRPCQRHRDRNKGIVSSEVSMLDKKVNRQRDRQPDRYRVTDRQTDRQIIVKRYTYKKFVSFEGSGHLYCKVESVTFIPLKWREHNADVIGGKPC